MNSSDWTSYSDRAAARRAAAQQHHPDRGGDAEDLMAAFAAIDETFESPRLEGVAPLTVVHGRRMLLRRWLYRAAARTRRATRRSRRYIDI